MIDRIASIGPPQPEASAPRDDTSRESQPFSEALAHARRASAGPSGTTPTRTDAKDSAGSSREAGHSPGSANGRGGRAAQGLGRQDNAGPGSPSLARAGAAAQLVAGIEGQEPANAAQDADGPADELSGTQSLAAQTLLDELRSARSDARNDGLEASGANLAQESAASPARHAAPGHGQLAHTELPTAPTAETSAIPAAATVLASADMPQEMDGDDAPHERPGRPGLKAASAGAAPTMPATKPAAPIVESHAEQSAELASASHLSATQAKGSDELRQDATPLAEGSSRAVGTTQSFGETLAALSPQHPVGVQSAQAPTAIHRPTLAEPVTSAAFVPAFAGEVDRMVMLGTQTAELMLTPRSLGPIRIELSLSGETATVAFSAAQPETRIAIEQSLPLLRTLLEERGIALGQANVGRGDDGGRGHGASGSTAPGAASGGGAGSGADDAPASRILLRSRGLVDLFA